MDVASVSYMCRRGARYHYRRRLYLRKLINRPITVPLGTADPAEARRLVSLLSVRWDTIAVQAFNGIRRGFLKAGELEGVFRAGLDEELGLAMAPYLDAQQATGIDPRPLRVLEATYRIAARLPSDAHSAPTELIDELTDGFSEHDRAAVILMLKALSSHKSAESDAKRVLQSLSAPVTSRSIGDARVQLLLARAEAQARAALAVHPLAANHGDPFTALLDDPLVADIRSVLQSEPDSSPRTASAPEMIDSPYLTADTRRFSEIVAPVIAAIQTAGDWNEDMAQRKRVMDGFAWIAGDKRLCDYRPADAELFAQTLNRLPTTFRWGTPEVGAMSRPLAEVLNELPPLAKKEKRSPRTLNRDLTTMSRVARELAKVAWKPKLGGAPIMNFNDFTAGVKEDVNDPDRMPWTEENLRAAFSSPIYTGGGGCMKRFKAALLGGMVWQDAAYWVPLIMAYTFVAREEACGLECADFVFDVDTPYIIIRANMTRSKDGETPGGLKRAARFRMIPLHPELLRLGLQAYIERIAAEGPAMAFPELYQEQHEKRGGNRFYACAGRYLLAYVDEVEPLLRTRKGKRADLHSMRTSGASALEDSEAKQLQVDDIMGHAREGMGPRKYSKAWYLKGGGA